MLVAVADLALLPVASVLLAVVDLQLTVAVLAHLLSRIRHLLLEAVAELLLSVADMLLLTETELLQLPVAHLLLAVSGLLHSVAHALRLAVAHLGLTVTNLLIPIDVLSCAVAGMALFTLIELLLRRVRHYFRLLGVQSRRQLGVTCVRQAISCGSNTCTCGMAKARVSRAITCACVNWNGGQSGERIQVVATCTDCLSVHDI